MCNVFCLVKLCTVQRARLTCAALFAIISVFIAPYHMMWVDRYPEPLEACLVLLEHEAAFTALYLTESFLFRIFPVFAIAILNIFIIVRIWRITIHRKLIAASDSRRYQSNYASSCRSGDTDVTRSLHQPSNNSTKEHRGRHHRHNAAENRTIKKGVVEKLKSSGDEKMMLTVEIAKQSAARSQTTTKCINGFEVNENVPSVASRRTVDDVSDMSSVGDFVHSDTLEQTSQEANRIVSPSPRQNTRNVTGRRGTFHVEENIAEVNKRSTRATVKSQNGGRREEKSLQTTVMLIIVSTSYVLAYIPVLVHYFIWKLERLSVVSISERSMLIAQNYTRPLYVAGFAINFFLYTVSGPIFRRQLVRVVGCNSTTDGGAAVRRNGTAGAGPLDAATGCGACGVNNRKRSSPI